jgi:PIN domain nuclease of toxin-antitoxin system
VKLLLDAHVWLWLQASPSRLHPSVLSLLEDTSRSLHLSVASMWEIAIKFSIGKLDLPQPPSQYVPDRLRVNGVAPLAVSQDHALAVAELPLHHRDPFDRLLVAQSMSEGFELLTVDRVFEPYRVPTIWADRPYRARRRRR